MYTHIYTGNGNHNRTSLRQALSVLRHPNEEYATTTTTTTTTTDYIKLSGLEVRPLKVSGGSPVHLRSKHQELVGKTLWVKKEEEILLLLLLTTTTTTTAAATIATTTNDNNNDNEHADNDNDNTCYYYCYSYYCYYYHHYTGVPKSRAERGRQGPRRAANKWYTTQHYFWIPFGDHPLILERYRED